MTDEILPYSKQNLTRDELLLVVSQFAGLDGAHDVWHAWKVKMRAQGRPIRPELEEWETVPDQDRQLDTFIAASVILDFMSWYQTHPHYMPEDDA